MWPHRIFYIQYYYFVVLHILWYSETKSLDKELDSWFRLVQFSLFGLRRQHNLIDDGNVGHIFFRSSSIFLFSLFHFPFKQNLTFSTQDSAISFTLQACVFFSIPFAYPFLFCVIFLQFCVLFQVMMLAIQTPRITPFRLSVIAASPFPLCPKYVFFLPKIST